MTTTIKTTRIAEMEAQRRELDRQIRAAKRAAVKAEKEALQTAQRTLGTDLSRAVGADSTEKVQQLRQALMSGQSIEHLRDRIAQLVQADAQHREDADGRWSE